MAFTIGDRVKLTRNLSVFLASSKEIGTIICGPESDNSSKIWYGVEYDNHVRGHDCNGKGKYGHCAWLPEDCLMLVSKSPVMKIKDWIKTKEVVSANGLLYLIENEKSEFLTKSHGWTKAINDALIFNLKVKAQMYLHFHSEEIGNPHAKITEHIFVSPSLS